MSEDPRWQKKALQYAEEIAQLTQAKRSAETDLLRAKAIIRKQRAKIKRLKQELAANNFLPHPQPGAGEAVPK